MKKIIIGLFGFGYIGEKFYQSWALRPIKDVSIKYICIKNIHKPRYTSDLPLTDDKNLILNDPEINLIIELTNHADDAFAIVQEALIKQIPVISANNRMIAEHLQELIQLQQTYNTPLLYEAACCAGIPIIRNLQDFYPNYLLQEIEGIINGTTNYILTQTALKGLKYRFALEQAQGFGYMEANPNLDLSGLDAKYKLIILLVHAFGLITMPHQITNIGIDHLNTNDLAYAQEKGWKVKLVATAQKHSSGAIIALIMPKFIKSTDPLYFIDEVDNGIKITTFPNETHFLSGKGAGNNPSVAAILADIYAVINHYKYNYNHFKTDQEPAYYLAQPTVVLLRVMLRYSYEVENAFKHYFTEIEETCSKLGSGYLIGIMSLYNINEIMANPNFVVSFILIDIIELAEHKKNTSYFSNSLASKMLVDHNPEDKTM